MCINISNIPIKEIIDEIIETNKKLAEFWGNSHGWSPIEAAELLSRSRLDRQVSRSHTLNIWIEKPKKEQADAWQILGYANIDVLVEGTAQLYSSVYYEDYKVDANAIKQKGNIKDPDDLTLGQLRQFFKKSVWVNTAESWDSWISKILARRNAIHAYKDRDIGLHAELCNDIKKYFLFLQDMDACLPYP